jgi:hypothetical protein
MKQTAVEWFYQRILAKDIKEVFEQAKEMEKQQIVDAWNNGFEENRPYVDHSEDYYNETFNQQRVTDDTL